MQRNLDESLQGLLLEARAGVLLGLDLEVVTGRVVVFLHKECVAEQHQGIVVALRIGILLDHIEQNRGGLVVVPELEEHVGVDHPPHGSRGIHGRRCFEIGRDTANPLLEVGELALRILELAGKHPGAGQPRRHQGHGGR